MPTSITAKVSPEEHALFKNKAFETGENMGECAARVIVEWARSDPSSEQRSRGHELAAMADSLLEDLERMRQQDMATVDLLRVSQSLEKLVQARDRALAVAEREGSLLPATAVQGYVNRTAAVIDRWLSTGLQRDLESYGLPEGTVSRIRNGVMAGMEEAFNDAFP